MPINMHHFFFLSFFPINFLFFLCVLYDNLLQIHNNTTMHVFTVQINHFFVYKNNKNILNLFFQRQSIEINGLKIIFNTIISQ